MMLQQIKHWIAQIKHWIATLWHFSVFYRNIGLNETISVFFFFCWPCIFPHGHTAAVKTRAISFFYVIIRCVLGGEGGVVVSGFTFLMTRCHSFRVSGLRWNERQLRFKVEKPIHWRLNFSGKLLYLFFDFLMSYYGFISLNFKRKHHMTYDFEHQASESGSM